MAIGRRNPERDGERRRGNSYPEIQHKYLKIRLNGVTLNLVLELWNTCYFSLRFLYS